MKVEREVIVDLLPAYFSGEASAATRALVEDYFRENPDFEKIARAANRPLEALKVPASALDEAREKLSLERARQITEARSMFLWLAVCFSALLLLFRVHDHKLTWIIWDKDPSVGIVFAAGCVFFWALFFYMRRRKEPVQTHTKFFWVASFYTLIMFLPQLKDHKIVLLGAQPEMGVILGFIAVFLWALYLYELWKVKRAKP